MRHFQDIKNKLEWEKYYDPEFNWHDENFYKNNVLSNQFIHEFQQFVNWELISKYQKLDMQFLITHSDKVIWRYILTNGWG